MIKMRKSVLTFLLVLFLATSQASQTVELQDEWSLVSPPSDTLSVDQVRQQGCELVGGPWGWDVAEQEYEFVEEMNPQEGYWLKVAEGCSITQDSPPAPPETIDLQGGNWDIISIPAFTSSLSFTPFIEECSMSSGGGGPWAYGKNGYSYSDGLNPNKGYFVKTGDDCEIGLEQTDYSDQDTSIEQDSTGDTSQDDTENTTESQSNLESIDSYEGEGWTFVYDPEGISTDQVEEPGYSLSSSPGEVSLGIDGQESICGVAEWQKEFDVGSMTKMNVDVRVKDEREYVDGSPVVGQEPQTFYIEVNDERRYEKDLAPGGSDSFEYLLNSLQPHKVDMGVEDLDGQDGLVGCAQYIRRTNMNIDVSLEDSKMK